MARTPDEIMADLLGNEYLVRLDRDQVHELLWEILEDALSSMRLALVNLVENINEVDDVDAEMDNCVQLVRDYLINHYGDD